MKKIAAIMLAGATALSATAMAAAPAAAASPQGYITVQHHDRYDRRDDRRDHRRWEREQRRDYRQDQRRWERDQRRWDSRYTPRGYYGSHPYFDNYGGYRTGQVYRYYGNSRYVINDYGRYGLPAPRPGYRYYRDDNGNVIMAAIASGIIGYILGGALN